MPETSSAPLLRDDQVPRGFSFAAVRAGLKASGKPDLACALAEQPAVASAMFTSNKVIAAPLIVGQRHLEHSKHRLRVALINAGNANCATGEAGILAAQQCCAVAGEIFGCDPHTVFPSSTGIIGVPLPVEKVTAALPELHAALGSSAKHLEQMAAAIMTTDTRSKIAAESFEVEGVTVRVAGIAKGAGMIHPQLRAGPPAAPHATMLVYVFTDAQMEPAVAEDLLHHAVHGSFNRISIDGDTSTNERRLYPGPQPCNRAHHNRPAHGRICWRTRPGLFGARETHRQRWRRYSACSGVVDQRGAYRWRRFKRGALDRSLSAGQDRMGGMRSELGTHPGRNWLRRGRHRSWFH
jgi:ArgJ family